MLSLFNPAACELHSLPPMPPPPQPQSPRAPLRALRGETCAHPPGCKQRPRSARLLTELGRVAAAGRPALLVHDRLQHPRSPLSGAAAGLWTGNAAFSSTRGEGYDPGAAQGDAWLIIATLREGLLAAFDDRVIIVKNGVVTAL